MMVGVGCAILMLFHNMFYLCVFLYCCFIDVIDVV